MPSWAPSLAEALALSACERRIKSHTVSELMHVCVTPPLNAVLGEPLGRAILQHWSFGEAAARDLSSLAASGDKRRFREFLSLACAVLRGESNDTQQLQRIASGH